MGGKGTSSDGYVSGCAAAGVRWVPGIGKNRKRSSARGRFEGP